MFNKRLMGIVDDTMKYVALNVFMNWVCLLANIFLIVILGNYLQGFWSAPDDWRFFPFIPGMIGLIAIRFGGLRLAARFSFLAAMDAKKKLRGIIYQKLLRLGPSYSEKISTAEAVQVAVEGIEQLELYFGKYLPQLFYCIAAPLTLFAAVSMISLKAALVMLACVLLIPLAIVWVQNFAHKLFDAYWQTYSDLGHAFLENLQGLTTLKIYQADDYKNREMNNQAEAFRKITMKVLTMQLNSITLMDLIAFGGAAAGILLAVAEFNAGRIPFTGAFIIILLASEFFIPLRMLGSYFHAAMNGISAARKIFRLLDLEEEPVKTESFSNYGIKLDKVSFSYDGQRPILQEVSLDIPERGFIAIAGESGSGKSTIAALMAGQRSYAGSMRMGGKEVSRIDPKHLRREITLVSHDSYIFKGTVEDNLKMGNPRATLAEMVEALKKVRLHGFVFAQEGLAMPLRENGSNLSGGQRQRLALARALLHDSKIYILDEATSNVDVESEANILEVVRELARQKTVILISHRLANVVDADMIYVLEHGRVAESGSHDQLMNRKGLYADLFAAQAEIEGYLGEEKSYANKCNAGHV